MCLLGAKRIKHDEEITCYKIEIFRNNIWVSLFMHKRLKYGRSDNDEDRIVAGYGNKTLVSKGYYHSCLSIVDAVYTVALFSNYSHTSYHYRIVECSIPVDCDCYLGTAESPNSSVNLKSYASTSIIKKAVVYKMNLLGG